MKRYMIHINGLSLEETTQYQTELHREFGENNVYRLDDNIFVIKTADRDYFSVMERAGFTDQKGRIGVVIGFDDSSINGRYSTRLWDFISQRKQKSEMPHVAR